MMSLSALQSISSASFFRKQLEMAREIVSIYCKDSHNDSFLALQSHLFYPLILAFNEVNPLYTEQQKKGLGESNCRGRPILKECNLMAFSIFLDGQSVTTFTLDFIWTPP